MPRNSTEGDASQQTVVYLGNRKAVSVSSDADGNTVREPIGGKRCTTVVLPEGMPLMDAARDITSPQGVWAAHSDAVGPAWVASTDPALAQLLASHYGCEVRDPDPDQYAAAPADGQADEDQEA